MPVLQGSISACAVLSVLLQLEAGPQNLLQVCSAPRANKTIFLGLCLPPGVTGVQRVSARSGRQSWVSQTFVLPFQGGIQVVPEGWNSMIFNPTIQWFCDLETEQRWGPSPAWCSTR